MKSFLVASILTLVGSCATTKYSTKIRHLKKNITLKDSVLVLKYANTITAQELEELLYDYTDEKFQGRKTGEIGQKKAAHYLKDYYSNHNVASPLRNNTYFQLIPESFLPKGIKSSENVLAFIKGHEKPNEVLIISAHYDHLGIKDGNIYYGADDDGSGTVAILEIAEAFKEAQNNGHAPKRSILFTHFTAEEIGLHGSRFYTEESPIFPLNKTIANLNIDMIGRQDYAYQNTNKDYIYLIGSDRLSKELHYISEKVNTTYFNLELDYKYNAENDSNRYYYRSDHYNFAKNNIPVIFYFNGVHDDYHKPTDTPDKINYTLLEKRTKLIFATAWQLANQDKQLIMNVDL
ncbi:M28 family peptidase [Mangrovimonas cancribranchiae]|uniref:M28 family peptidase n=1 Tax=Mangrovimonas cancribranchiae TaxID=3080055 RepID=A0AAU6P9X2_9FLAO